MKQVISNIKFQELLEALSNNSIRKTSNGEININGTILSSQDFDTLYLGNIRDLFFQFEKTLSPEFSPSKEVYSTLDSFSNPVLKNTSVPDITKSFKKKLSEAIISNYGTKLSGKEVLDLANQGYVEPEKPITMLKYKSLYIQDPKSPDYVKPVSHTDLLEFYSPEKHPHRMLDLLRNNKFSVEFQEFHEEMLENVSNAERKNYIQDLIDEAKHEAKTSSEFSTDVLGYANNSIIPDENLEHNISGEFLKKQYENGELPLSRIIEIYSISPEYFSAVQSVLTDDAIKNAHRQNEVSDNALMYIPENSRMAYLHEDGTSFSTIMYLFLHCDTLSAVELSKLIKEKHFTGDIEHYIDFGSSPTKILELYENFLIDYGCIKFLHSIGILKAKDMNQFGKKIDKQTFYQELDSANTIYINNSANSVPFSTTGSFIAKQEAEKAPSLDVYQVLGKKDEKTFDDLPKIEHKDNKGNIGFLNDYRIVNLHFSGLVAFIPAQKGKNIYIMPYQEAAYIIKRHRLPDNFTEHDQIKEIRHSSKENEDILKAANSFEEARTYLDRTNYNENLDFESNFAIMLEQYQKIKIKGEN